MSEIKQVTNEDDLYLGSWCVDLGYGLEYFESYEDAENALIDYQEEMKEMKESDEVEKIVKEWKEAKQFVRQEIEQEKNERMQASMKGDFSVADECNETIKRLALELLEVDYCLLDELNEIDPELVQVYLPDFVMDEEE